MKRQPDDESLIASVMHRRPAAQRAINTLPSPSSWIAAPSADCNASFRRSFAQRAEVSRRAVNAETSELHD